MFLNVIALFPLTRTCTAHFRSPAIAPSPYRARGFTLAELLIALAILGVIATFTIPKILDSGSSSKHNSIVKEAAGFLSEAFQQYRLSNSISATTSCDDLTQYINYVARNTTSLVDQRNNSTTHNCSLAGRTCLLLHNGAMLVYDNTVSFSGTGLTNAIWYNVDPDGVYGGSTTGPSKATQFFIYTNGMLRTKGTIESGTISSDITRNPDSTHDPEYFSWGS